MCSELGKVKLSLYQADKFYRGLAMCCAPAYIFMYIGRYENQLLFPSCLSVRLLETNRFPLEGFSLYFMSGLLKKLFVIGRFIMRLRQGTQVLLG